MSLFGTQTSSGSPFGSNAQSDQQKSGNPFASLGNSQPTQQTGLFTSSPSTAANPSGSSLFGSQPNQSGSLFGATTSQPPQQQTTSLFGTATSQPQTSSLFGSTTQQGTGSLFGGMSQTQPQQTNTGVPAGFGARRLADAGPLSTGGSLFASAQQPQANQSGSVFGATQQNQNLNQTQQSSASLFGGATNQPKLTLSTFGTNNNTQNTQSSLFGGTSLGATANSQPMLSLGSLNTQSAQPSNTLFGSTNAKLPGTLTMGQTPAPNQQQTVPGVRIDVSNLRGTTRFNDLHDELQKQIEQIDNFIQQQIGFKEQCDALMPAHEQNLSTIPNDVDFIKMKVEATESTIDGNSAATNSMKTVVQQDADSARISFRAVENLKLPQQFHYSGIWQPTSATITPPRGNSGDRSSSISGRESTDLVSYFNAQALNLSKMLENFKERISEIETHLGTMEASTIAQNQQLMFQRGRDGGLRSKEEQLLELSAVLKQFEQVGIESVAGRVGQLRGAVVDVVESEQRDVYALRR